jgi:exosortase
MAVLAGLVVYAFWFAPVSYDETRLTTFEWLTGHWSNVSNYSHGPLIPLIASVLLWWNVSHRAPAGTDWRPYWKAVAAGGATLGIWLVGGSLNEAWEAATYRWALLLLPVPLAWQVWTLREHLRSASPPLTGAGVATVAAAMALYYVGVKSAQARVVVVSGVVLLLGLAMVWRGREVLRLVFFPICFLLLMVPLNFLDNAIGFPLRMFVAKAATIILNLIGIEAVQRGSGIISAVFRFDVADPCSGIRSLMALTTVTAAFAYVTQQSQWKRWFLFLCAMPLAVFGNLARVISIAVFAQVYGQELAAKVYHDWSGFILFPVALGAMVLIAYLLNFDYRRFFRQLTQPPQPRVHHEPSLS